MTNRRIPQSNPFDKLFYHLKDELDNISPTFAVDNLLAKSSNNSYPPYDIISQVDKDKESYQVVIQMALAGFDKDEIDIEVKSNSLTVSSEGKKDEEVVDYIHKGISKRSFKSVFKLSPYSKVVGAEMNNGMLNITIEFVPPKEKANKIEIK